MGPGCPGFPGRTPQQGSEAGGRRSHAQKALRTPQGHELALQLAVGCCVWLHGTECRQEAALPMNGAHGRGCGGNIQREARMGDLAGVAITEHHIPGWGGVTPQTSDRAQAQGPKSQTDVWRAGSFRRLWGDPTMGCAPAGACAHPISTFTLPWGPHRVSVSRCPLLARPPARLGRASPATSS